MLLRTILVWSAGLAATLLFFIPAFTVSVFDRSGNGIHLIGRAWARTILFLSGVVVEREGIENLLKDASQVIVANHQSAFDILVLHAYLPLQFRWVSKKEVFKIPLFGWAMKLAGYVSMDRNSLKRAFKDLESAGKKLEEGFSILIFPEGTRSRGEGVKSFKRGGFLLAVRTGFPVTPVTVIGTDRITRRGLPWIAPARVRVCVGRPFETSDISEKDIRAFMEKVRGIIKERFDRMSEDLNSQPYGETGYGRRES